jgi:hypothetical protein
MVQLLEAYNERKAWWDFGHSFRRPVSDNGSRFRTKSDLGVVDFQA